MSQIYLNLLFYKLKIITAGLHAKDWISETTVRNLYCKFSRFSATLNLFIFLAKSSKFNRLYVRQKRGIVILLKFQVVFTGSSFVGYPVF